MSSKSNKRKYTFLELRISLFIPTKYKSITLKKCYTKFLTINIKHCYKDKYQHYFFKKTEGKSIEK